MIGNLLKAAALVAATPMTVLADVVTAIPRSESRPSQDAFHTTGMALREAYNQIEKAVK